MQRLVNLDARVCGRLFVPTRGLNVASCTILSLLERVE